MADNTAAFPPGVVVTAPDGTAIELRPLTLRDMADVDQAALASYRKQQMRGAIDAAELRYGQGTDAAEAKITAELERLQGLTADKVPMFRGVPPIDARAVALAKQGAIEKFGPDSPQAKAASNLDKEQTLPWSAYWMGFTTDGLIFVTWLAARHSMPVTFEQWDRKLSEWGQDFVKQLSEALASISESKLGK